MQAVGLGTLPVMVAGVPDVLRPLLDQVVSQGWPSSSRAPARRGWTSCRASKALPLVRDGQQDVSIMRRRRSGPSLKLMVLDPRERCDVREFVAGLPQQAQDARDAIERA